MLAEVMAHTCALVRRLDQGIITPSMDELFTAAANGIELHPVLAMRWAGLSPLPPSPATKSYTTC